MSLKRSVFGKEGRHSADVRRRLFVCRACRDEDLGQERVHLEIVVALDPRLRRGFDQYQQDDGLPTPRYVSVRMIEMYQPSLIRWAYEQ